MLSLPKWIQYFAIIISVNLLFVYIYNASWDSGGASSSVVNTKPAKTLFPVQMPPTAERAPKPLKYFMTKTRSLDYEDGGDRVISAKQKSGRKIKSAGSGGGDDDDIKRRAVTTSENQPISTSLPPTTTPKPERGVGEEDGAAAAAEAVMSNLVNISRVTTSSVTST
jgi:hypothetical protein